MIHLLNLKYIYDENYTAKETDDMQIKITWPDEKSLQNINKLINSGKSIASKSILMDIQH